MRWRALALVFCVVLTGCAGANFDPVPSPSDGTVSTTAGTPPTDADSVETDGDDAGDSNQKRTDGTSGGGIVADRENPWGESTLTVAIDNEADKSRDFTDELRTALDYWEANSEEYAGYALEYEVVPNAENPDIVVNFVEKVESCPRVENAAGCAPYVTKPSHVSRPMEIDIGSTFSDESIVLVLKHEFGHTLGLNHSSAPQSIMADSATLKTAPQTDAADRPLPWADAEFTVYLGPTPDRDREAVRSQVERALGYFADGADGTVPSNLTFSFVRDRSAADVIIQFPDDLPCQSGASGSCGGVRGIDPDRDGSLEEYDRLLVSMSGIDTEAVGWYVGYWLGYGMGLDESELPPPLRDASYDDRRSRWWA
jgi:hypothetical protein